MHTLLEIACNKGKLLLNMCTFRKTCTPMHTLIHKFKKNTSEKVFTYSFRLLKRNYTELGHNKPKGQTNEKLSRREIN